MRTTVTLEPDVEALVKRRMRERGLSFKQALNDAVRTGLAPEPSHPFSMPTASIGFDPSLNLDKALRLAGEIEDGELLRRIQVRK